MSTTKDAVRLEELTLAFPRAVRMITCEQFHCHSISFLNENWEDGENLKRLKWEASSDPHAGYVGGPQPRTEMQISPSYTVVGYGDALYATHGHCYCNGYKELLNFVCLFVFFGLEAFYFSILAVFILDLVLT